MTKGKKGKSSVKKSNVTKSNVTKSSPDPDKSKKAKTVAPAKRNIKNDLLLFAFMSIGMLLIFYFGYTASNRDEPAKKVTLQTTKGNIVFEIYPDKMPVTTGNFEKLVSENFYDGLTFHRVENWVIQGGDPQGDGSGGPGWTIQLETHPELKNLRGAVAMARSEEPDSAGSQFYILKEDAAWLDGDYAVFGRVIEGMEVVDQIQIGDVIESVTVVMQFLDNCPKSIT